MACSSLLSLALLLPVLSPQRFCLMVSRTPQDTLRRAQRHALFALVWNAEDNGAGPEQELKLNAIIV